MRSKLFPQPLGVKGEKAHKVAKIFNCKLAHLPMKYLGILVGDRYVEVKAAEAVVDKLGKRLDNWRNNFLSSGGRLVLVNSNLSRPLSIPWVFMDSMRFTKKWIMLDQDSSGERLMTSLNTIW